MPQTVKGVPSNGTFGMSSRSGSYAPTLSDVVRRQYTDETVNAGLNMTAKAYDSLGLADAASKTRNEANKVLHGASPDEVAPVVPSAAAVSQSAFYTGSSGASSGSSGSSKAELAYLDADLAKAYGMDASTAYQEALSNTSYQRAVKDLQAAGLNPVLAASDLNGAGGVYTAQQPGSTGSSGASSAAGAHDMYKILGNVGSIIGAALGSRAGYRGASFGSSAGNRVGQAIGNLIDLIK